MHISDLAGGLPSGSYIPSSLPLHTTVSDKLKKKVWALKYVDFVKFLDVDEAPKKGKISLEISKGKITEAKRNERRINDFKLWDKAFMV